MCACSFLLCFSDPRERVRNNIITQLKQSKPARAFLSFCFNFYFNLPAASSSANDSYTRLSLQLVNAAGEVIAAIAQAASSQTPDFDKLLKDWEWNDASLANWLQQWWLFHVENALRVVQPLSASARAQLDEQIEQARLDELAKRQQLSTSLADATNAIKELEETLVQRKASYARAQQEKEERLNRT